MSNRQKTVSEFLLACAIALPFGIWQESVAAGVWMLAVAGAIIERAWHEIDWQS